MKSHKSNIKEFYKNQSILLTGSTGFIGQLIIEKLLRTCPDIKHIYIIVRDKKGKTASERIEKYFDREIFDLLKEENPNFREKLTGIIGDLSKPLLGLTSEDQGIILKNVDIIFHAAATVGFTDTMRTAISINLIGTKEVLNLSKKIQNLKALIYVSTAYSNCGLKIIDERIYDYPATATWDRLISLIETLNNDELEALTPVLVQNWPNTYCFSKALTEVMIKETSENVPVAIFRPGIVISTAYEPIKGWADNFQSPTGIVAGIYVGLIKAMKLNKKLDSNMVPGDMVAHALIATAWDRAQNQPKSSNALIPVYNFSLSPKTLTWGDFVEIILYLNKKYPVSSALWYPFLITCVCDKGNKFYQTLFHSFPAYIAHYAMKLFGKQTRLLEQYKRMKKQISVVEFFCSEEWHFETKNITDLWNKLSPVDQELFKFNLHYIQWNIYLEDYIQGMRRLLFKEDSTSLSYAKKRRKILYVMNQIVLGIVLLGFIIFFFFIVTQIF